MSVSESGPGSPGEPARSGPERPALDTRAFADPVDREALRRYRTERAARRSAAGNGALTAVMRVIGSSVVIVLIVGGGSLIVRVVGAFLRAAGAGAITVAVVPFVLLGALLVLIAWVLFARWRRELVAEYRLDAFARANGLAFGAGEEAPQRPGLIFSEGKDRTLDRVLRAASPRFLELANYRYTTGSGKNRTTHYWGYAAIRIGTPLPHIVLDAVGNDGLFGGSNLPAAFGRDQRLRLEGDFDRHFALYCPAGYERDALYLFTPDIMARFIDHAGRYDVEIVDDWLFLYAQRRKLVVADPAALAAHLAVVDAVAEKLGQWERWRDERLEPPSNGGVGSEATGVVAADAPGTAPGTHAAAAAPAAFADRPVGVAAPGLRLRRRFPWGGFIVFVAAAGFMIWTWMR
ncbi:hypothetical protein D3248_02025 [Leucobacter zeae]|nr:hypothetical protein [Leucobacter zeae]